MNYIWSDLHLNHEAVLRYENRPFNSVQEMNKTLIKNWRETVSSKDTIFNLGDVSFKTTKDELEKIIKNLPGKKVLILGNHDRSKSLSWWRDVGFDEVYPYPIIYEGFFMLSHEPLYICPEMPYVNIHGHTHGECFDNYVQRMNVSVENIEYKPVSLDDLVFKFKREDV
jgi:calcineurin-like phosphoesterase family protein